MARILGSLLGELSGKMGGLVFSRNGSGAYVRQYVKPVNPNSVAQQEARTIFTNSASAYHALTDSEKSQWSSYASSIYNPLIGTNDGQFSGFNAFISSNVIVKQASASLMSPTISADPTPPSALAETLISTVTTPPSNTLSTSIVGAGSAVIPFINTSLSLPSGSGYELTLNYDNQPGGAPSPIDILSILVSATGQKIGVGLYMSNGVQQPHDFINSPFLFKLFQTGLLEFGSDLASDKLTFNFSFSGTTFAGYKDSPSVNEYVKFTPFIYSEFGQVQKLDTHVVLFKEGL